MLAAKGCRRCGGPLGEGRRSRAEYCAKSCYNAAYKIAGEARPSAEKQREYARQSYRRLREAKLNAIGVRLCVECGDPLPRTSRLRRVYCSQRCVNAVSLREGRALRIEHAHRYRTRRRAAASPGVTERDWKRLVARYGGCCAYCGTPGGTSVDHVVPLSRGGRHSIGNVLPACKPCNSSKGNRLLIDWRTRILPRRIAAT